MRKDLYTYIDLGRQIRELPQSYLTLVGTRQLLTYKKKKKKSFFLS